MLDKYLNMPAAFPDAVLDDSLLVQAVMREKRMEAALKLLETLRKIYAPPLIFYEAGNTLVALARRASSRKKTR